MDVTATGLEARATVGWECPKCHSVHAPFISTCSHCDASKYPRVQAWLLTGLRDRLNNTTDTHFDLTRNELERLVSGSEGK